MAFPSSAVVEARSSANSANNGAFYVPGLGGGSVDYSQADSPQLVLSDVVTSAGSAVITSATGGFTAAMVGNGLSLIESSTPRWYYVATFTSSNQVTLDKNVIGGAMTGVALRLGGAALLSTTGVPWQSFLAPGNKIWEKGSFSLATNALVFSVSGTALLPIVIEGYGTTRGDGGMATHTRSSGNIDLLEISGVFYVVKNLTLVQGNNFNTCFKVSGFAVTAENVLATMAESTPATGGARIIVSGSNNRLYRCRADGQSGGGIGFSVTGGGNTFDHCESYGSNEEAGFKVTVGANWFTNCISRDNTGDGFTFSGTTPAHVRQCDISKNGRDGIRISSASFALSESSIIANIFNRNGQTSGYEINYSPSDVSANTGLIDAALENVRGNAFYVTGLGKSHFLPPFTGDVTLSADPFVDSGSGHDFTLNTTVGGGLTVRSSSLAVAMPGGAGIDYLALGALATGTSPPPPAPSALTATALSGTRVDLTWTDNATDEVYYFVERSDNGGSYNLIATLAASSTSYSDLTVTPGNSYTYRVRGVN